RSLDIVAAKGCQEIVTSRLGGNLISRCGEPAVDAGMAKKTYLGPVYLSKDFAPIMTYGVPLEMACRLLRLTVADRDMVALWDAVKEIRVGQTGYARLITADGTLIAHGDPEERRRVSLREKDPFAQTIRGAAHTGGTRYNDSQGRDVIAESADVPDVGWTVIV